MLWMAATLLFSLTVQRIDAPEEVRRVPGGVPFVSLGAGALDSGFAFRGGSWMQLFATQQAETRFLMGGFTVEGSLLHAVPVSGSSATRAYSAQLRIGWTGERFSIAAGPSLQLAPQSTPSTQLLPTARAVWMLTDAGLALSGGVFDLHGAAPLRLSLELPRIFGFGYVAPLGVEGHAALPLGGAFELRAQALGLRMANATQAMLLLSAAFTGLQVGGAR